MKRFSTLLCVLLVCVMCFSACGKTEPQEQPPVDSASQQNQLPSTEVEPEMAEAQQSENTEEAAELPDQKDPEPIAEQNEQEGVNEEKALPYTVRLRAEVSIFAGPGYDFSYDRVVGKDGVYTIVEESMDAEDNLWGKLKSGVGWVDLTAVAGSDAQNAPMTACFADGLALIDGQYQEHLVEDSEYTVRIAFRANEDLHQVTFNSLQYGENAFEVTETHFTMDEVSDETYLVVGVVFPGDMTTYGISFSDSNGEAYHYALSISGRNGELEMNAYEA